MNASRPDFSENDIVSQFRDAMCAAGIEVTSPIIADGKLHRYHVNGDHRSKRNAWAVLHADERPAGVFGCNKRMSGESVKWTAKGLKRLSVEERRALMAKMKADAEKREKAQRAAFDAAAAKAVAIWDAADDCESHPYLTRKCVQPYGLKHAEWVRDLGHDAETGEVREVREPFALLVPVKNSKHEVVSLQAIFPEKNELLGRDKDFLPGGEKRGCYYAFGLTAENREQPIVITEGYATAASLHEATGFGCVVAFDAGNLIPVAEAICKLAPARDIIIAADNDQFTAAANGTVENPGVFFATRAAAAVGGFMVVPQFASLDGKPTDFNDLHVREGLDAVRDQMAAWPGRAPAPAPEPEPEISENFPETESGTDAAPAEETEAERKARLKAERAARKEAKVAAAAKRAEEYAANPDMYDPSKYFTLLGHDRTKLFVYSHEMKLVVSHGIDKWNKHSMLQIAPPDFWKKFSADPDGNEPPEWDFCENWLIRESYRKGFYDPGMTRGRGAWMDEGRIVYHFGNMLMVDGVETAVTAIKSKYVYEQGKLLPPPADEALSDAEGRAICEIAKLFRWTKPGSAVLLAGWAALAPVCGALKWRPHIWITGAAGSGKTTALNDYLAVLTAGTALFSQGNSTEAGIRQKLQSDALPVLFDESEQQDEKAEQRVQNIIALFRQASSESGAKTYKGTTNGEGTDFNFRSMGALSSIGVTIKNDADRDRLTVLALRPRRDDSEQDRWPELKEKLYDLNRDPERPARFMRRALEQLPTTLKNIEVFAEAAAKEFGSRREGDQYGTLMAGAWSLCSGALVTHEQAKAMIDRYDWSDHVEHTETDDSSKALSAVLVTKLRLPPGDELTVHELIVAALESTTAEDRRKLVKDMLRRRGMLVDHPIRDLRRTHLFVAFCAGELMKPEMGTSFVPDFKGQIGRLEGAIKPEAPVWLLGGNKRGVLIPLTALVMEETGNPPRSEEIEDVPF
jgi:putative DNA primase/helicase